MRISTLFLIAVGVLAAAGSHVRAENTGPFRLLGATTLSTDGTPTVKVTPVRIGPGWRGWGFYPGADRPTAPYAGSYNRAYGYTPSNGYYRGPEFYPAFRHH